MYHEARRESYFKLKYGITLEKREELLKQQDYKCAICFTELLKNGGATHIDHCHSTGKIRGMLCTNCNRGLGHFQDNKEFLMRAVKYLEQGESQ